MRREWRERLTLAALLIGLAGLIWYAMRMVAQLDDPSALPYPLSYSRHPKGAKGLAKLLQRNGYQVRSLRRPFRHLPRDADMLIMFPASLSVLLNLRDRWGEEDLQALHRWVESGGVLAVLGNDERLEEPLQPRFDPPAPPFHTHASARFQARPLLTPRWMEGISTLELGERGTRLKPHDARWVPLIGDAQGVAIALHHRGRGVILECADSDWLTNAHLQRGDNGAFILAFTRWRLPEGGVIYFDDAGQGDLQYEGRRQGFWDYAPAGLKVAFAHLMVLTILVMYSVGRRFGLPRPARPRTPTLGEYVDALAGLYASARAAQPAMEIVVEDTRRHLCKRLGLPAGATLLQVMEALPADSEVRRALNEIHHALQQPSLSEGDALRLLQSLERALER
ncbi:MAG: DUF4350 domain-containing protein [Fimbriimonadales bacterium]|nr:DUF4350 domain-containing protein [Fimbriimonadales bacterium]